MSYKFILINTKKNSTREQISTIDRAFGDNFLKDSLGRIAPSYSGYIIMPNRSSLSAMWLLPSGAVGPLTYALKNMKHSSYSGEIWRDISNGKTIKNIRVF